MPDVISFLSEAATAVSKIVSIIDGSRQAWRYVLRELLQHYSIAAKLGKQPKGFSALHQSHIDNFFSNLFSVRHEPSGSKGRRSKPDRGRQCGSRVNKPSQPLG